MNRRRIIGFSAAILVLLAVAIGVGPRLATLFQPPGEERITVVFKTIGPHMEFWQIVRAGIETAATEYDIEPTIVGPLWEKDIDEQIAIMEGVIEERPDAILLVASDYNRLVPLTERAVAEGILVVTLDSALNSDAPASFVATDNVAAGAKVGREIDSLVPFGRAIAIMSHIPEVATAIDREEGVRSALSHRDPDTILGTFYSYNEPDRAYEIVEELLATHPEIGGFVALNENSTVGVGRALRDLNVYDRIHLVGFDNSKEEIDFLEKGIVKALVVQKPFNMGYVGIRTVVEALRGTEVAPTIYTDSVLVRQDNMFTEENQKLLFPIVQGTTGR